MKNLVYFRSLKIITSIIFYSFIFVSGFGQVSGLVFRDYNGNGIRDSWNGVQEPGIGNVVIKAYNNSGNLTGTVSSDAANGSYSFTGLSGMTRLELELPGMEYDGAFSGSGSKSTIRFVDAASNPSNINFALSSPDEYFASTNPMVYTIRYCNGNMNPGTQSGNTDIVLGFNYTDVGIPASQGGSGPEPQHIASGSSVGSVWGTAYSKQANKLFVSAFLKRHVGMGPGGSGAIYMLDVASPPAAGTVPPYASLDAMGYPTQGSGSYTATPIGFHPVIGTNAQRGLPDGGPVPSADASAFGQVGKVSLGDLDISADGKYLFTVNLYDRKIYRIDLGDPKNPSISNSSTVKTYSSLPWFSLDNANGKARPFALKYYKDYIYVGVVTTEENITYSGSSTLKRDPKAMRAFIYKIDPNGNGSGTVVLEFPLNYTKETASTGDDAVEHGWYIWSDNYNDFFNPGYVTWSPDMPGHNQPILSDIEFDHEGSMMLALMDRVGHQWGVANWSPDGTGSHHCIIAGDILRTYFNKNTSTFTLEADGVAGPYTSGSIAGTSGALDINTGPGTPNGTGASFTAYTTIGREFFYMDGAFIFGSTYPEPHHNEGINGGLALYGPSGQVMCTGLDPDDAEAWSGGVYKLNTSNGSRTSGYNLFTGASPGTFGGFLGKANGMGDVEVMNEVPPIEIGNRVWNDTNSNGIQDAGEAGISGVSVQLYNAAGTTLISTATTDANGNYIFSSGTGTSTAAFKYGITQLIPNTNYIIRVPTSTGGLNLTTANAGSKNTIDSDAPSSGDVPILASEIPMSGANNHTFDIGYSPASCSITTTATPGACESNTYTLTGNLTFSNAPATGTLTVNVAGGGSQVFNAPFTSPQAYSIAGLAADGASHTVTAVFSADANCTDSETYTAPASCSTPPCCTECTAPDGNHWMKVENLGNPADGPSYSTVVNGNTIVHDDPDQVGRGVVPYTYFIRDGFVTYKEYLAFLNAVDPTNSLGFREGLYSDNGNNTDDIFTNNGTSWSFAANFSNCHQNLTAAQLENMTIHKISYNSAARFCNWKATGNIETGAYTFEPGGDAWKKITNINYSHPGPRLPNEDEYYKASYWNSATNYWNLFGTNSLDANGLPIVSSLNPDGTYTNPNGIMYKSTLCPGQDVYMEKYPRQGAKSPCGLFMTLGGYHDWINPRTPSYPIEKMTIRTGNEYAWEDDMKSSFYDNFWYSSGGYYPSPSFRLVTTVDPCAVSCSLTSAGKTNEACNNNGTPSNSADDYITFSLNPTGTGLGTGYTVTASGGATVTPTTGTYGSASNFRLQNGSANGTTYNITITDNGSSSCTTTTTVVQQACSTCPPPDCLNIQMKKN